MKRMWAPEELNELAVATADAEILAKVNISYEVVSGVPTWTFSDNFKIEDRAEAIRVNNSKRLYITGTVRLGASIFDADNNIGSVKKIYCHPITISGDSGNSILGLFVFNNDSTPLTKTTFIQWIDALYESVGSTIRIITTGAFLKSSVVIASSYMGKNGTNSYYIMGVSVATGISEIRSFTTEQLSTFIETFNDGVNAIN